MCGAGTAFEMFCLRERKKTEEGVCIGKEEEGKNMGKLGLCKPSTNMTERLVWTRLRPMRKQE